MYACNISHVSSLHSFLKGEDIVISKKEEEEKSIQEPVSNIIVKIVNITHVQYIWHWEIKL